MKLLSYNTSFINDAHNSQLHTVLSESASIMQKAINELSKEKKEKFDKAVDYDAKYGVLTDKDVHGDKLYKMRQDYDNANSDFILKQIPNCDFISLIEQTIHAGKDDKGFEHCYYVQEDHQNAPLSANLDLDSEYTENGNEPPTATPNENSSLNKEYGLQKNMIKYQQYVQNISEASTELKSDDEKTHYCVFDTIMTIPPKEGILIMFKKNLIDGDPTSMEK